MHKVKSQSALSQVNMQQNDSGVLLSKDMIKKKCKTENLIMIKNINFWGNEIRDLSVLKEMPSLEIVSLSLNKVTSLKELGKCPKIQEIYLRKN